LCGADIPVREKLGVTRRLSIRQVQLVVLSEAKDLLFPMPVDYQSAELLPAAVYSLQNARDKP
jgi:hypothetical protein